VISDKRACVVNWSNAESKKVLSDFAKATSRINGQAADRNLVDEDLEVPDERHNREIPFSGPFSAQLLFNGRIALGSLSAPRPLAVLGSHR
jgi:hypothetical protein